MTGKVILISLRGDETNTLATKIARLNEKEKLPSLEGRDDVSLISAHALLADRTTAHGIVAKVTASLVSSDWPYLLLPLDEAAVAAGTFEEELKATLERFGVRFDLYS